MPVVICNHTARCFFLPRGEKLVWQIFSLQFILQIFYQSFATIGGGHSVNIKGDDLCRAKIKKQRRVGGRGQEASVMNVGGF
jgi:hypothetical protein